MTSRFLDGVRVVTTAQNVPGPLAAARMRDAGAMVTKIEPLAGDPFLAVSPAWHAELHSGIAIERIDLKSTAGRERLTTLLRDADILLTSQRPSALARLGLDPASLRTVAPSLRIVRIVGSVADPERPGHDLTYQAQVGLVDDCVPRALLADVMASERAFSATLAVLRQPVGSVVDVGLVESLEQMMASLRHGLTIEGGVLGGGAPRYAVYETAEGRVAVAALEPHFERHLARELGAAAGSELAATFRTRSAAEWQRWAEQRGLPIVAIRNVSRSRSGVG